MDDSTTKINSPEQTGVNSSQLGPFWIVIGLFAFYACFLMGLAFATANPVLINARQIENSQLVFVGQVLEVGESTVEFQLKELLKGEWDQETILVSGFKPNQVVEGENWVVPALFLSAESTQITPLSFHPNAKPTSLVYPSDKKTVDNLKSRLSSGEDSP
ncbi:MAG: hypothetical protein P8M30_07530 [Planctomycetaceae bacterium]|jgi:hypothetical protein|nr:hypothetical protein [Planctomycetaceae bacterium]